MLPLLLVLVAGPPPVAPDVLRAFDHSYNLEYDEALAILRKSVATELNDPHRYNYIAQATLYKAMLKAGALESELVSGSNAFLRREKMNPTAEEQAAFDQAIATAFEKANARLQANPKDADALYSLAITHGLRGNYNFLVRKAWIDALKDSTASRKNAQLALDADPTYVDAKIILGLSDYIVGSLSWTYKMLGVLAGFRGDREGGIRTLEEVSQHGVNNRGDAKVLLGVIYRREKQPAKAVPLLEGLIAAYPRNYLFRLELAQMFADQGERDKSLAIMNEISDLQQRNAPGFGRLQAEKIAYQKGNQLFWFDEYDKAIPQLQQAVNHRDHLDLNTAIMSCLRLGQTFDLLGRRNEALNSYHLGIALAPSSDLAKECSRYTDRPYKRKRIE